MQAEALFFREIQTPLGLAVLSANSQGLTGFYFSDQRDCPVRANKADIKTIHHPQAGEHQGVMLRRFKVAELAGRSGDTPRHDLYTCINWGQGVQLAAHSSGADDAHRNKGMLNKAACYFDQAIEELDAYFRGRLARFSVPLSLNGTAFQLKVWRTLAQLPRHALISYGELGRAAGVSPQASRAVGVAVGRNPLSIIVPCHRVVASNAQLTGYGGGLERKVALLEHEGFRVS